ncbi:hypothetical protein Psch_01458 [Pelotomaculum schinkii]|uniref:HemN C-terminal domain-containing protein n=1 Tax=Pelotomaculum schinkii TaxID=78350 RepID=A0A4Y7RGI9_9FIRM|nr:hypothetical protein [Pelotomaculum schinkii]TEB07903.1 hypothetical protein Psch_01458 [Pelotomaculum schinkii]
MFGVNIRELVKQLLAEGYVTAEADGYRLTPKGIYWGNNICDAFFETIRLF